MIGRVGFDSMMLMSRTAAQLTGDQGETLVAHHLTGQGWQVVAQQWRCRWGELDVVAHKGSTLAFVEVKTRSGGGQDPWGLGAMGSQKQGRLIRAAQAFLAQDPRWASWTCRFDVALVQGIPGGGLQLCRYIPGAFEVF